MRDSACFEWADVLERARFDFRGRKPLRFPSLFWRHRAVRNTAQEQTLRCFSSDESGTGFTALENGRARCQVQFAAGLAGIAAWLVGWRLAFMLLLVPIVLTALAATRLREPVRGATDEPLTETQKISPS